MSIEWLIEDLRGDLRGAARNLRRCRLAFLVTVLSLGFGIGGVTVTFTFMKAVILNPPPLYRAPGELRRLFLVSPDRREREGIPAQVYAGFAQRQELFSGIAAAAESRSRNVRFNGGEESVPVQAVTPSLLAVLGVQPAFGRPFVSADSAAGAAAVVLVSHRFWQRELRARADVLGSVIRVDGVAHVIVGVMPERYYYGNTSTSLWTPLAPLPSAGQPLDVIMRAPHVSERALVIAVEEDLRQYRKTLPPSDSIPVPRIRPIFATSVRDAADLTRSFTAAGAVILTLFAVLLTLAITCANVAVVMIAQWADREQERAIRAVLGAGRRRIVRMLVFETLIIAVCAGGLGLAATAALSGAVARAVPESAFYDFSIDGSVLLTTSALTLFAGLLSGVVPALSESRKLQLNPGRMVPVAAGRGRFRSVLVAGEIAVVIALLVVLGAMVNSYSRMMAAGGGFQVEQLVRVRVESEAGVRMRDVLQRLRSLPGVEMAAAGASLPIFNNAGDERTLATSGPNPVPAELGYVGSDYFRTAGMNLLRGREFFPEDDERDSHVAIVNQTLARRLWPDKEALGEHVWINGNASEVIAVAADYVSVFMTTPPPVVYLPLSQRAGPIHVQQFLIRTSGDPMRVVPSLRSEIAQIGADQSASRVATVKNEIEQGAGEMMVGVYIFAPLVIVGLLLSAAGMYGILAIAVSSRTRELAIRMAVGGTARDMFWLVARQTSRLVLIGTGIGTLLMVWLVRVAQHESAVFAKPTFSMFAVPILVLLLTSVIASWVPVRRAMQVDPALTLRGASQ